jgi:hypothetical protein
MVYDAHLRHPLRPTSTDEKADQQQPSFWRQRLSAERTLANLANELFSFLLPCYYASVRDAFLRLFLHGFAHQILDGVTDAAWVLRSHHLFHEVF